MKCMDEYKLHVQAQGRTVGCDEKIKKPCVPNEYEPSQSNSNA
jgi:hypothetical protein